MKNSCGLNNTQQKNHLFDIESRFRKLHQNICTDGKGAWLVWFFALASTLFGCWINLVCELNSKYFLWAVQSACRLLSPFLPGCEDSLLYSTWTLKLAAISHSSCKKRRAPAHIFLSAAAQRELKLCVCGDFYRSLITAASYNCLLPSHSDETAAFSLHRRCSAADAGPLLLGHSWLWMDPVKWIPFHRLLPGFVLFYLLLVRWWQHRNFVVYS